MAAHPRGLAPAAAAIIGGGPAGLMAAEILAGYGCQVDVYDAMASVGRKFLLAGKGGLNLTHAEELPQFVARYGDRRVELGPLLAEFGPTELRAWARSLGVETFVGTSRRVFPVGLKAAPLLRAWLHRLRSVGVRIHARHRWLGWDDAGALRFATPAGEAGCPADAVVLALGGASWPQLGSDGAWIPLLQARGVAVVPLQPANCGFDVGWSGHFRERFAGDVVKSVAAAWVAPDGSTQQRQGELTITQTGVEGGLIYALSAVARDRIATAGSAGIHVDLAPDRPLSRLAEALAQPRGSRSLASYLRSRAGIAGVKAGLLRELASADQMADPERLAAAIKSLPLRLVAPRPLGEAISTAGGVAFDGLDRRLMIRHLPGVFCAGEMLDWEAPTGGYLLTACFATGRTAGLGAAEWLAGRVGS